MYAVFEFKICAHAYYWPRAVEKMNGQGRQAGADRLRQVSEKEKQELTEVLTKAGLLHLRDDSVRYRRKKSKSSRRCSLKQVYCTSGTISFVRT